MVNPNCYNCQHRRNLAGDCHSRCVKTTAKVVGSMHGIKNGWFFYPVNFDPIWLEECDGYEEKENNK
jgi:hypothetical protein